MLQPGITLIVVAKDEEARIARCIDSVRAAVSDVVVVDTGSTDRTREIAAQRGARVVNLPWRGRFDEPLNRALQEVRTEWTLRLDADEWFSEDPGDALSLMVSESTAVGFFLIRRDLFDDLPPSEIYVLRLWRTHPDLRFEGIVHERLAEDKLKEVAGDRVLLRSDLLLMHDGYTGGALPHKRKRNVELLRRAIEECPEDFVAKVSLAEALVADRLGEGFALVQELASEVLDKPELADATPMTAWLIGVALESTPDDQLFEHRTQRLVHAGLKTHFENPITMWGIAGLEIRRNNLWHAYHALLQLEEMGQTGIYDRSAGSPEVFTKDGAWHNLALVSFHLGKEAVAKRNYDRLIAMNPNHPIKRELQGLR
ncbi:MAG TPA: glycosyltransferase [Fimbriimonadaceae bacterium]|nr:glycosyltransferase [Fimbriimonadaceae bacterium]